MRGVKRGESEKARSLKREWERKLEKKKRECKLENRAK